MRGYSAIRHPRYILHEEDDEGIKVPSEILETLERNAFRSIWRGDDVQDSVFGLYGKVFVVDCSKGGLCQKLTEVSPMSNGAFASQT